MNLLKRQLDNSQNSILLYREYQYSLVSYLFKLSFNYLRTLGLDFDPSGYTESISKDTTYHTGNYFATNQYKIKLDPNNKDWFLNLTIPDLLDGQFFQLNGALYVPGFFITDSPVIVKKRSILCYSLFNSLTLFTDDNRAIFLGNNIPISRFLNIFLDKDEVELACSKDFLNCENLKENKQVSIAHISTIIGVTNPDLDIVIKKINDIFFDEWTLNLYKEFYNLEYMDINILIREILFDSILDRDNRSFIDLHYKRLVFIEYLLNPFFRAISVASKYTLIGQQPYKLNLNIGDIIKYFFIRLDKFNFYGIVNGFSGLLDLKATFKTPNASNELPIEVSSIHSSYRGKIDVVSISNTDPGKVVNLVPDQNLRSLKYGIFDFTAELK